MGVVLANVASRLRTSFWFLPAMMAVGGFLLAVLTLWIDRRPTPGLSEFLDPIIKGGSSGAGAFLATLAGSIITVTGLVFSITIMTLSLASGQFGSRLIRSFMRDRGTQGALGVFIATFVYCLIALLNVGGDSNSVERLTVVVALLLTLTSIGVLIFFMHHVAVAIQADTVVGAVHRTLLHQIDALYPKDAERWGAGMPAGDSSVVEATRSGYIQLMDEVRLARILDTLDMTARVRLRVGDFIQKGAPLLEVWPAQDLDAQTQRMLVTTIVIGDNKTEEQDVDFAVDQLVEVAVRALSPGINDPNTALACTDFLGSALSLMASRPRRSPHRFHGDRLRVEIPRRGFTDVVDDAFAALRLHGRSNTMVLQRLLSVLEAVAARAESLERRRTLVRHAIGVVQDARRGDVHNPADIRAMEERQERLVESLLSYGEAVAVGLRRGPETAAP